MNTPIRIIIVAFLVVGLSGCAELRRKFIRKREPKKEDVSFYSVQEYNPAPAPERYQEHYVFWKNWHLDLERTGGTSYLRDMRAMDESLRHLTAMRDLLKEEKAAQLQIQIDNLEDIRERMRKRERDVMEDVRARRVIERTGRIIVNNFSYNAASDYLKSENRSQKNEVN